MRVQGLVGIAAAITAAEAVSQGFNYGNTKSDGSAMMQADFQAQMKRAQDLQGTSGFTSGRLYTMIQAGTTNDPIQAIPAAIATKTQLLLGMWCSAGQDAFDNEIAALKSAISTYGTAFTSLVTAISVGSEDLYRDSPTGIENDSGAGATPDELVSYIKQAKSTIAGTSLSGASIGHVDTWTAWVNSSNFAVTDNIDWLGMDSYPYFETTVPNSIGDAKTAFWQSYNNTKGASQGKEVWITETGWPVSGPNSGQAVASIPNAETYWQEVACELLGNYNTWWYTLQDALPTIPSPSFGIIGPNLNSAPLYNLSCKKSTSSSDSSSSSTTTTKKGSGGKGGNHTTTTAKSDHTGTSNSTTLVTSGVSASGSSMPTGGAGGVNGTSTSTGGSAPGGPTPTPSMTGTTPAPTNAATTAGTAMGACILAIFGLVAAL